METFLERNIGRAEEIWAYGMLALTRLRRNEYRLAEKAADTPKTITGAMGAM